MRPVGVLFVYKQTRGQDGPIIGGAAPSVVQSPLHCCRRFRVTSIVVLYCNILWYCRCCCCCKRKNPSFQCPWSPCPSFKTFDLCVKSIFSICICICIQVQPGGNCADHRVMLACGCSGTSRSALAGASHCNDTTINVTGACSFGILSDEEDPYVRTQTL